MDTIKRNLDATLKRDTPITKEEMREIIDAVVYAEARAAQQKRKEEKEKEEDDPEHPGEKKAWIEKQEITYLNIRQQKTGAKVAIPCNSALKAILEKYNYQVPHLADQVINRYIKADSLEVVEKLTDKYEYFR